MEKDSIRYLIRPIKDFKIRFEDSVESSNLTNLKIRESYDSTITVNFTNFTQIYVQKIVFCDFSKLLWRCLGNNLLFWVLNDAIFTVFLAQGNDR